MIYHQQSRRTLSQTIMYPSCSQTILYGQPIGFDFSRLEFDVPNDGKPLIGWEFRIKFGAKLGVGRKYILKQEAYERVCAYYRGNQEVSFIFHETTQQWEN